MHELDQVTNKAGSKIMPFLFLKRKSDTNMLAIMIDVDQGTTMESPP